MKNTTYIVFGIFILVILLYGAFAFSLRNQRTKDMAASPTMIISPTTSGQTYVNNELGLSLLYPHSYTMKNMTRKNGDPLLFLIFTPPDGKSYEGIQLVIFPQMEKLTVEEWVSSYTTSSNTADLKSGSRAYMIDQVHELAYKMIDGKKAAVFTQGSPDTAGSQYVTLFIGKRYVIYLAQQKSLVGSDYQAMLSSLSF